MSGAGVARWEMLRSQEVQADSTEFNSHSPLSHSEWGPAPPPPEGRGSTWAVPALKKYLSSRTPPPLSPRCPRCRIKMHSIQTVGCITSCCFSADVLLFVIPFFNDSILYITPPPPVASNSVLQGGVLCTSGLTCQVQAAVAAPEQTSP